MMVKKIKDRSGFGLVEMLVSLGLFAVITSVAVGGFARALRTQRQATGLLLANSNISITIEQIMREMRTGYNFCTAPGACPSLDQIDFKNARGEAISYRLNGATGTIEKKIDAGAYQPITADDLVVQHLEFRLQGNAAGDGEQPRITITLGVSSKESGVSGNIIDLQTTVSPRLPLDT